MPANPSNTFLQGPLGAIYVRTALPIIFVMGMNGLLAVADALFLGRYVGPDALAAVTLMFPVYMLIVALSTLVASGMSSLLARHLGGDPWRLRLSNQAQHLFESREFRAAEQILHELLAGLETDAHFERASAWARRGRSSGLVAVSRAMTSASAAGTLGFSCRRWTISRVAS